MSYEIQRISREIQRMTCWVQWTRIVQYRMSFVPSLTKKIVKRLKDHQGLATTTLPRGTSSRGHLVHILLEPREVLGEQAEIALGQAQGVHGPYAAHGGVAPRVL